MNLSVLVLHVKTLDVGGNLYICVYLCVLVCMYLYVSSCSSRLWMFVEICIFWRICVCLCLFVCTCVCSCVFVFNCVYLCVLMLRVKTLDLGGNLYICVYLYVCACVLRAKTRDVHGIL